MLHQYQNYSHSLSRLLGYHQFEGSTTNENEPMSTFCGEDSSQDDLRGRNVSNKSFTIAAILGLKGSEDQIMCPSPTDLSVVNLSVHSSKSFDITDHQSLMSNCNRLQFPIPHNSTALHPEQHFSLGHHQTCQSTKPNVRGVKHISSSILQNSKKNSKSKRVRTIFTPEQLERLEAEFERQQYMVGPERLYLAHTLQLTEAQVKVWFQNRRIKWRKHHLELTHQRLAVLKQQQMLLEETQPDVQDSSSSSTDNTS